MATNVIMPALGISQDSGKLLRWLVAEGQPVTQGQLLMEIETDKVTVEIEAPASGVLSGIQAKAGDVIPVGHVVAVILASGETPPLSAAQPGPVVAPLPRPRAAVATPAALPLAPVEGRRTPASPKARRLAEERGVDLSRLTGSGPDGEITAADVLAAVPSAQMIAISGAWQTMADRLTRSWSTVPHFFLTREVHAQGLVDWRKRFQAAVPAVTFTDLLVSLAARTLRRYPRLTARWDDGRIVSEPQVGIGVAVATDDGLIVPVIPRPDELSVEEIASVRHDLVTRAQGGRLRLEDVRGGTFTISNLGMYGVDMVSPIINPPQAAILGVGRIADRVVAIAGSLAVRPTLILTLACDHRVVDGARAAEFLDALAQAIEGSPP
jgi:pyruvate dehydrogenase E2 component (dihydrolipoamide acetyltransferase)